MRIVFAAYTLDTSQRQLECEGESLHLSPKAFRLLERLIESAPAAVSREALYDELWGETYVVEANLANLISEIRTALGDSHRDPRFIRTVHRHGYAFVGDLQQSTRAASRFTVQWGAHTFPLHRGVNLLGRDESCDVRVQSAGVSRAHAAIVVTGDEARVEDRGSKNGTLVGSTRVLDPIPLSDGDVIGLGSVRLTFHVTSSADSTMTEHASAIDRMLHEETGRSS